MKITVKYRDKAGTISNQTYILNQLAFAKNLAIARQGYAPRPQKIIRTIATLWPLSNASTVIPLVGRC